MKKEKTFLSSANPSHDRVYFKTLGTEEDDFSLQIFSRDFLPLIARLLMSVEWTHTQECSRESRRKNSRNILCNSIWKKLKNLIVFASVWVYDDPNLASRLIFYFHFLSAALSERTKRVERDHQNEREIKKGKNLHCTESASAASPQHPIHSNDEKSLWL